jgi:hypothetical protein
MLRRQVQRIIHIFTIVALIVATVPHGHSSLSHHDLASADLAQLDGEPHHHHHDHEDEPAPTKNGFGHSHGHATADHVHEKPFRADNITLTMSPPDACWYASPYDERPNALCAPLDRPPRIAGA